MINRIVIYDALQVSINTDITLPRVYFAHKRPKGVTPRDEIHLTREGSTETSDPQRNRFTYYAPGSKNGVLIGYTSLLPILRSIMKKHQ